jgi:hypothetical protein
VEHGGVHKIHEEEEDGCGSDEGHAASYKYKTGERVRIHRLWRR